MASGPLRLIGRFSASNTGHKPIAINHCARVQVCHQRHAPKRPPKVKINTATAANESHKPGRKLASGSSNSTALNASNNGHPAPR
ncbi:hypothetical protein D3C78_1509850 [compost metagenome]